MWLALARVRTFDGHFEDMPKYRRVMNAFHPAVVA